MSIQDNIQDDPQTNVTWHKAAPTFGDELIVEGAPKKTIKRKNNVLNGKTTAVASGLMFENSTVYLSAFSKEGIKTPSRIVKDSLSEEFSTAKRGIRGELDNRYLSRERTDLESLASYLHNPAA